MIEGLLAKFTRIIYWFPGSYFIARYFFQLYSNKADINIAWRIFCFKGVKLKVNIKSYVGGMAYWRGAHEMAPMYLFQKIVKKDMIVYDIGANIGEFTIHGGNLVGGKGKVISFEPVVKFYNLLNYNISLNKFEDRITVFNIGLSDKKQVVSFSIPSDPYLGNNMNEGMATQFSNDTVANKFDCKLGVLDEIFEEYNLPKPDIIKIDIEGGELFALLGATMILSKFKPRIILEFSKENCTNAGYDQRDLLKVLIEYNYNFKKIGVRGVLTDIDFNNLPTSTNLYCY
jgi:FkbM family methyltransferase